MMGRSDDPFELSALELTILRGLARGLASKELAVEIGRSKASVELYVRSLATKFHARSRAHLVAMAICRGVISTDTFRSVNAS